MLYKKIFYEQSCGVDLKYVSRSIEHIFGSLIAAVFILFLQFFGKSSIKRFCSIRLSTCSEHFYKYDVSLYCFVILYP